MEEENTTTSNSEINDSLAAPIPAAPIPAAPIPAAPIPAAPIPAAPIPAAPIPAAPVAHGNWLPTQPSPQEEAPAPTQPNPTGAAPSLLAVHGVGVSGVPFLTRNFRTTNGYQQPYNSTAYRNNLVSEYQALLTGRMSILRPTSITEQNIQNTMTINKCPGLKRCNKGKWWVPIGKDTTEVTYCDFCKRKYDIKGVSLVKEKLESCNCDSYLIKDYVEIKEIFKISFWSQDLSEHYSIKDNVVNIPTGTCFSIFVDGCVLSKTQVFKVNIELFGSGGKETVKFYDYCSSTNIYHSSRVLFLNLNNLHKKGKKMHYLKRPDDISDETWDLFSKDSFNKLKIEISVYNKRKSNHELDTNKFLGIYNETGKIDLNNKKNNSIPRETHDYNYPNVLTYIHDYNYERLGKTNLSMTFTLDDTHSSKKNIKTIFDDHVAILKEKQEKELKRKIKTLNNKVKNITSRITEFDSVHDDYEDELSKLTTLLASLKSLS